MAALAHHQGSRGRATPRVGAAEGDDRLSPANHRTRIGGVQAYDELCFPGLAAEWAGRRRPFTGALTMPVSTDGDDEVVSWISAGTPPIYLGFGSMSIPRPAETIMMIADACAQLGERAVICSGWNRFSTPHFDHVKIVSSVNHDTVLPHYRAAVHHGGAGTTAAGLRAGLPTLILWFIADQPVWGVQLKRLKIGWSRRFSCITTESL